MHEGGALVLAGAGTGKTRVLTGRIARLLLHSGARERDILAVTFTNKAAKEMRARVEHFLSRPARALALGTFHGVCHRILRAHAAAAGLDKNFQILDSQDQLSFIRRLLRENNIDHNNFPPGEIRAYISAAKENGWRAGDAANTAQHSRQKQMAHIYVLYEAACKAENKTDFGELMLRCTELLREDRSLREHYAQRFRHILIDEFQDTNRLQFEWLKLLDGGGNEFFAVGDDDQAIYSFRGTRPENMRDFQTQLRAGKLIRLEQNYRSTKEILNAANKLIACNKGRLGKTLSAVCGEGEPVVLQAAENDLGEADDIAERIQHAKENATRADDIAVLYRTNAQSRALEQKMVECGIAYRIYGGTRFFDRAEVKHALAYMRLAASEDKDSILRVINFPPRGVGAKAMEQLSQSANLVGWENAVAASENKGARKFSQLLAELREAREKLALGDLARAAVEKTGLIAHYDSRKEELERAENLREFVNAAAEFESGNSDGDDGDGDDNDVLLQFLANAALESGEADSNVAGEAVNLMTVHAAKGLEFDAVLVAGLEEGLFPHENSLDDPRALEEERRLMYVATTRARKSLSFHFARSRMHYGQRRINPPSRFLDELECFTPPQKTKTKAKPRTKKSAEEFALAARARRKLAESELQAATLRRRTSPEQTGGLRPGASVRHDRYGLGVVLGLTGEGNNREVAVAFKSVGKKNFKTSLAKLQVVG